MLNVGIIGQSVVLVASIYENDFMLHLLGIYDFDNKKLKFI